MLDQPKSEWWVWVVDSGEGGECEAQTEVQTVNVKMKYEEDAQRTKDHAVLILLPRKEMMVVAKGRSWYLDAVEQRG